MHANRLSDRARAVYVKLLGAVAGFRWGSWIARHLFNPVDHLLRRSTGGKIGLLPKTTTLLLVTKGRKSGARREHSIFYVSHDDSYWVVGSNYGQPTHPSWTYNLSAHPQASVTIGGRTVPVRARRATDAEVEMIWPRFLSIYPTWSRYRDWTDRSFRVFRLDPAADASSEGAPLP